MVLSRPLESQWLHKTCNPSGAASASPCDSSSSNNCSQSTARMGSRHSPTFLGNAKTPSGYTSCTWQAALVDTGQQSLEAIPAQALSRYSRLDKGEEREPSNAPSSDFPLESDRVPRVALLQWPTRHSKCNCQPGRSTAVSEGPLTHIHSSCLILEEWMRSNCSTSYLGDVCLL